MGRVDGSNPHRLLGDDRGDEAVDELVERGRGEALVGGEGGDRDWSFEPG